MYYVRIAESTNQVYVCGSSSESQLQEGEIKITESQYSFLTQEDSHRYKYYLVDGQLSRIAHGEPEPVIPLGEHEQVTVDTQRATVQISEDNLLSMELGLDTNGKATTTIGDSLLLMELLISIDEKLTSLKAPPQA